MKSLVEMLIHVELFERLKQYLCGVFQHFPLEQGRKNAVVESQNQILNSILFDFLIVEQLLTQAIILMWQFRTDQHIRLMISSMI